jgi:hypothetical protein
MQYQIVAISNEIARLVRTTLKSPKYGHPAHVEVASGYGPCRSCLQTFVEGQDERILFTYDSFTGVDGLPSPGPVFIHRGECKRFEAAGFPPKLRSLPLMLEGYGRGSWRLLQEPVVNGDVDTVVDRLLAYPAVEYIQVRNAEAGCFMARIERAPSTLVSQ